MRKACRRVARSVSYPGEARGQAGTRFLSSPGAVTGATVAGLTTQWLSAIAASESLVVLRLSGPCRLLSTYGSAQLRRGSWLPGVNPATSFRSLVHNVQGLWLMSTLIAVIRSNHFESVRF